MMQIAFRRLAIPALLALVVTPSLVEAQRGMRPRRTGPGGNPVAPLIDLRRELDLSSRQLMQLDSIERSHLRTQQMLRKQLQTRMDSTRPARGARGMRQMTEEERTQMRAAMRARMDSLRPLREQMARNDSTVRARALAVLTDSQRVRVREWQAEQRGFARGRLRGHRAPDGPRGFAPRAPRDRGFAPSHLPRSSPFPGRRMVLH